MLNWYGNHKIGLLGSANSGKTIFLTSLLWHLSNHNSEYFATKGNVQISSFKIKVNKDHDFNFFKHKNTLVQEHKWPEKTADYAIATCQYQRERSLCERKLSFVDIPGERMSDILLWQSKNYSEWVEKLNYFWDENPTTTQAIEPYRTSAKDPQTSIQDLSIKYKTSMWAMLDAFCPITPSTYYLGTDGQMLENKQNEDREKAIHTRPIWSNGELLPLPTEWLAAHPDQIQEQEKIFREYKKKVLKPLFSEILSCDNYILCIDILNIMMSGLELLLHTQSEFKNFIDLLAPSKFSKCMHWLGHNKPRLAFVATKADMVPGHNKDNMELLLNDFANTLKINGINSQCFICSSCTSTELKQNTEGQKILIGHSQNNPEQLIQLTSILPPSWPDHWEPKQYKFSGVAPVISAIHPPKQSNLDKIFEFIVEDIKP